MRLLGLFPSVTVPPPLKATVLLPARIRSVLLPPAFRDMPPALLMVVPFTVRDAPLLKLRRSSASTVMLAAWAPPISRVTADAPCALALPLSISTFVPFVGTPFDQLPGVLQAPDAPPTQHVPPAGQANVMDGLVDVAVLPVAT